MDVLGVRHARVCVADLERPIAVDGEAFGTRIEVPQPDVPVDA